MTVLPMGDVCDFSRGLTYKKSDEVSESNNAVLRANNITLETGKINFDEIKYISDDIKIPESKKVKKGSLLICTASGSKKHLGKIGLIDSDIDFAYGGFMGMLTPKNNVDSRYLYWVTQSKAYFDFIQRLTDGANINNLKFSQLTNFPVPMHALEEQKRIVAILDQACADIEQARAKTEQNLKNARELFESYLQQVFSQRGEGWTETNLGAVAEFKNGLNFSQSSKGEKLKVVGVKDFKSNFMVPFEQLDTIQIDGDLSESYELKENDIITVRSNGNKRLIGRCLLMGNLVNKTSYSGFTIRIRLEDKSVFARFLAYYLKSSSTHELLINSGEGANISNLNQKILTSLPVAFPHFDKQVQLVNCIEKVEAESQELEKVYANKLKTIDVLKKSILQKAFSGELTKTLEDEANKGAVA
ncbi:restriction endonuclease subunit S [Pseudoalteromonas nigrifaciens]|uniref:restriction endonuclease subunit S n=1 Tax=Pseudoalteromonas nigrifaciens TaxID=28109 RepID=UPI001866D267|nr:restriction endonuclease subunit S [Pseudoalteromonas nigrifaciens]